MKKRPILPILSVLCLLTLALFAGITIARYQSTLTSKPFNISISGRQLTSSEKMAFATLSEDGTILRIYNRAGNLPLLQTDGESEGTYYTYQDETNGSYKAKAVYRLPSELEEGKTYTGSDDSWRVLQVANKNIENLFIEKFTITKVEIMDTIKPKSLEEWFYGFANCSEFVGLSKIDTSKATSMKSMFWGCSLLSDSHVDGWNIDTASARDLSCMFRGCSGLSNGTKLSFTNSVRDLNPTSEGILTNVEAMFRGTLVRQLNLENLIFATDGVNLSYLFKANNKLESVTFSSDQILSLANAGTEQMFDTCSSLKETLDISFIACETPNASHMFHSCHVLKKIIVNEKFRLKSGADSENMFNSCSALIGGNGTGYVSQKWSGIYARIDGANGRPGYFTAVEGVGSPANFTVNVNIGGVHADVPEWNYLNQDTIITLTTNSNATLPTSVTLSAVTEDGDTIETVTYEKGSDNYKISETNNTLTIPAKMIQNGAVITITEAVDLAVGFAVESTESSVASDSNADKESSVASDSNADKENSVASDSNADEDKPADTNTASTKEVAMLPKKSEEESSKENELSEEE